MKKRILLLPIIGSFLLTGCKLNLFGKTIYLFENKPSQQEEKKEKQEPSEEEQTKPIDDVIPEDMHKHATSLTYATNSPNAPFYLKVNEVRNIGVSLSPSPDLDEEKTVSWSIDTDGIVKYDVNESDTKKLTLTGLKAGTAKLTATNDYNQNLTYTFTIKVIDFDEENDYLWQYTSADRAQFGYVNEEGKKAGVTEGDAVLNGVTWHFTRSKATSLQSSMGAVGFGKNAEPETLIHFETDNIRTVEKFTIEAASANSLAKMTVKVGDTVFMDEVSVPRDYYDVIVTIKSADNVTPTSGKIEIDVVTPEYDAKEAVSSDYLTPGGFFLKSILINFASETVSGIKVADDSKHKVDYFVGEEFTLEGLALKKVSESGYEFDVDIAKEIEDGNLSYTAVDLSEASHSAKTVDLSLNVEGYDEPFACSFDIHVRGAEWIPTSLEIEGEVSAQELIEGDLVDYSNITIKAIYEVESDFITYHFSKNNGFTYSFDENDDPFVALKKMENGYTIDVSRKFVSFDESSQVVLEAHLDVAANVLEITEAIFDRIDFEDAATLDKLNIKSGARARSGVIGKDDRLRFDFTNVYKEKGVGKVNKDFTITILDNELCFDSIEFTFGFSKGENRSYRFKNPPEALMFWPDYLGGGYHYMKTNILYLDTEQKINAFNCHIGRGQVYDSEGEPTEYIDNDFRVKIPVKISNNSAIINLDISTMFDYPHAELFTDYHGIMNNQKAMKTFSENIKAAFER